MRYIKDVPLIIALLILVGYACTNQDTTLPVTNKPVVVVETSGPVEMSDPDVSTDVPETSISPSDGVSTSPTPAEPGGTITPDVEAPQNTQYNLIAELDYWGHHLAVEEQISYLNRSPEALTDLLLIVEPTRYPSVFRLNSLTDGDGQPISGYSFDLGQLRVPLLEPLPPGERIDLVLSYELDLPSPDSSYYGRPVPFGYNLRQTNLVDWYPFLPPYIPGEGWLVHPAGFFGEHLVYEAADFQVRIHLTDSKSSQPASSGQAPSEGAEQDLIIAASAPAEMKGDWYHYSLDSARNFVWSVSHMYEVTKTTVGPVTILGYAFPVHAAAGEKALQVTAEALALYNDLYTPYPRKTLSVVEADFLDGLEFDGLYFLSQGFYNLYGGKPDEYLTAIAAHETAHQWWYGLVGNDQALEPWLDEALCTYSERLYYEHKYPEALDWWWTYRVNYYQPRGWVNGSIYNPEGYRAYRDAVYLNGAVFLETLRQVIGDEVFFNFMNDYVAQNTHMISTTDIFFAILENHTREDLTSLLAQYFVTR